MVPWLKIEGWEGLNQRGGRTTQAAGTDESMERRGLSSLSSGKEQ